MARTKAFVIGALLLPSSALAAETPPHLWSCDEQVQINGATLDCATLPREGVPLKAGDVVTVLRGRAVLTDWERQLIRLDSGKQSVRIGSAPATLPPSLVAHLQDVWALLFGGVQKNAILKGGNGALATQPTLLLPLSTNLPAWQGEVRWCLPPAGALALRVWLPSGQLVGAPRLLEGPSIQLGVLDLDAHSDVILEVAMLDHAPSGIPSYLSQPTDVMLRKQGKPVFAVIRTKLHRDSPGEQAARSQGLEQDLPSLSPLHQAAVLLAAGQVGRARSTLERELPGGLPAAWQASLSGVEVRLAP